VLWCFPTADWRTNRQTEKSQTRVKVFGNVQGKNEERQANKEPATRDAWLGSRDANGAVSGGKHQRAPMVATR
jgi:hypothetical protein